MTANERPKIGAILLAAGGSTRLGRSKQLLKFEGETLVRRAARILAESSYFPVVVVKGKDAERVDVELVGLPVYSVINDRWSEGMSSSIRTGLARLLEVSRDLDGVLITLCDQPKVTGEMLNRFAAKYTETTGPIVAAAYDGILGVPALFYREIFPDLLRLEGDKGARQLIRDFKGVEKVDLPEAGFDIDIPADAVILD